MSYIDAKHMNGAVYVTERRNGVRKVRNYPAPYFFYVEDKDGPYTSMYGDKLSRVSFSNNAQFKDQIAYYLSQGVKTFESDVRIEYKLLEKEYCDDTIDPPHVLLTDIETVTDPSLGFADYRRPHGAINAITNHLKWLNLTKTYVAIPPDMTMEEATALVEGIDNIWLFETDDEKGILDAFYKDIEDADQVSGWNSNGFDIPYIIQRTRVAYGKEDWEEIGEGFTPNDDSMLQLLKLSPFDWVLPEYREIEMYGTMRPTFHLSGMVHIDYLDLYQKFSMSELHSYKLDYVLEHEIKENKVAYDGTLDQLWKLNFRKFCEYSIQDVNGLVRLDNKLKFIELANNMAHQSCVFLKDALGSVSIIEQGILVELHKKGLIAPDKKEVKSSGPVAGAFVHPPTGGMYDWVCSYDIMSLYPSVIRMLNISPETVIGQFDISETVRELDRLVDEGFATNRTEAWHNFTGVGEYHEITDKQSDKLLTMVTNDGESMTLTAKEWHEFFKEENMCLSANGTVFDLNKEGIVSSVLTKWYANRKQFQQNKKAAGKAADLLLKTKGKKVA